MIGVEKIGEIRRAYFEQHRSIKEIVRTLSVSRATVRKVVRGHQTEFQVRARGSARTQAWRLGRGSDGDPGAGSQAAEAGTPVDAAAVRGIARAWI
jgi:hypothetical protein